MSLFWSDDKIKKSFKPEIARRLLREKIILKEVQIFQNDLCELFNLLSVIPPNVLKSNEGINDDLNGIETPLSFDVGPEFATDGKKAEFKAELPQSLAKWKREYLTRNDFPVDTGICVFGTFFRKSETVDKTHSWVVKQLDWEAVLTKKNRNVHTLMQYVNGIYSSMVKMEKRLCAEHEDSIGKPRLPATITFIHAENLLQKYGDSKDPKELERRVAKEYGAVCIIGIGHVLSNGEKHDGRAPDYDDWSTETYPHIACGPPTPTPTPVPPATIPVAVLVPAPVPIPVPVTGIVLDFHTTVPNDISTATDASITSRSVSINVGTDVISCNIDINAAASQPKESKAIYSLQTDSAVSIMTSIPEVSTANSEAVTVATEEKILKSNGETKTKETNLSFQTENKEEYKKRGLNADIIFWSDELEDAIEISSMGIRVTEEKLVYQLKTCNAMHRLDFPFHKALLEGKMKPTIGGGIGVDRLAMFMVRASNISQVQPGVFPDHCGCPKQTS